MSNLFLASEIMAINISEERNGAVFYNTLADSTMNAKLEKAARAIAEQEKYHEKRFSDMLEKLEKPEPDESYAGEYDAYLQALTRNKIFNDEHEARERAAKLSDIDAIKFALKTEEATLKLLRELVKNIDPRDLYIVNETIQEEEQHISQLNELLTELT